MSAEKLSSDAVPAKFTEFLLSMGCPAEKMYQDKISEMCRGQLYMVWRSLMEHVDAKDIIRKKRLQVFCNDVRKCQKRNNFSGPDSSIIVPEQLSLWKQQHELTQAVEAAKSRVDAARHNLSQGMEKVAKKMLKLNESRRRTEDTQRRAWLLEQVSAGLRSKKDSLRETKEIAHSLCSVNEDADIQEKLSRCVTSLRRQAPAQAHSTSVNTSASGEHEFEEQLSSLVRCRGDVLGSRLYEARAALVSALASTRQTQGQHKITPQSVLAHTAALHCELALDTTKNRINLKRTAEKLAAATFHLNSYLPTEACELLVIQCERVVAEAKVASLRAAIHEIARRESDLFQPPHTTVQAVNQVIESKKEELCKLITAMAATERKIRSVRECLSAVWGSFRGEGIDKQRYRGLQLDLPTESLASILEFYSQRERRRVEISLELDTSDRTDSIDLNNPTFSDELKLYLKKFNLEKNRKLVLESGHKIWIFETISASMSRIHHDWLSHDLYSDVLCPYDGVTNLNKLVLAVKIRDELQNIVRGMDSGIQVRDIDIKSQSEEEQNIRDKTKKQLKDSLNVLQKSDKNLDSTQTNLKFWSDNLVKEHISQERKIDGVTYKDYEVYYLDSFN